MKEYKLKPQGEYYLTSDRKTIRAEFNPEELSVVSNKAGLFVKNTRPDDITITLEDHITIFEQVDADESNNEQHEETIINKESVGDYNIKFTYYDSSHNKKEVVLHTSGMDIAKELYNNLQLARSCFKLEYNKYLFDGAERTIIPMVYYNEGSVSEYLVYHKGIVVFSIRLYSSYNKKDMDYILTMPENKGWSYTKSICI